MKGLGINYNFNRKHMSLGKKRENIKLTYVKYLTREFLTPAWILIYRRGVATIHTVKNPICLFIKDREVVKSYTGLFNLICNMAHNN